MYVLEQHHALVAAFLLLLFEFGGESSPEQDFTCCYICHSPSFFLDSCAGFVVFLCLCSCGLMIYFLNTQCHSAPISDPDYCFSNGVTF